MPSEKPRIVCQFSCGAASAVATKLALAEYGSTHDVQIINAFLVNEHEDNRRFLADCEVWFDRQVTVLRDTKYGADIIEVFRRERFMMSRQGAPCTRILKRRLMDSWKRPGDVMVFGYTAEESDRLDDFRDRNPDRPVIAPLIERGLGKDDFKAMVQSAGIELPIMYSLGYDNANCIGCVKGGEGYFRAIREDFPDQFESLCQVQDLLGPCSYLHRNRTTNERFSLRDLGDGPVRRNEKIPACSFFCEIAEADIIASMQSVNCRQRISRHLDRHSCFSHIRWVVELLAVHRLNRQFRELVDIDAAFLRRNQHRLQRHLQNPFPVFAHDFTPSCGEVSVGDYRVHRTLGS